MNASTNADASAFARVGANGAIIDSNTYNITIAAALVNNGAGGLTKNGDGELILSNTNTYVGATTINAGTLRLNTAGTNNIANSSAIHLATSGSILRVTDVRGGFALASGQTLSGVGTVTGNLTSGAGALSGTFSNYSTSGDVVAMYSGGTYRIYYGADLATNSLTGGNDVVLVSLPEPTSLALTMFGMMGLALKRRRASKPGTAVAA